MGTKNNISFKQKLEVMNAVREHLEIIDEKSHRWLDGWHDRRIATTFKEFTVTEVNVASIRREMFGYLSSTVTDGKREASSVRAQLQDHEERIQLLEAEVDRLSKLSHSRPLAHS